MAPCFVGRCESYFPVARSDQDEQIAIRKKIVHTMVLSTLFLHCAEQTQLIWLQIRRMLALRQDLIVQCLVNSLKEKGVSR